MQATNQSSSFLICSDQLLKQIQLTDSRLSSIGVRTYQYNHKFSGVLQDCKTKDQTKVPNQDLIKTLIQLIKNKKNNYL